MLTTIVDQVSKLVGQGYLISAFLPWLTFCLANGLTLAALLGPRSLLRLWQEEVVNTAAAVSLLSLLGLLWLVVCAYLVASLNGQFKRLLEGQSVGFPFGVVLGWMRKRKRAHFARLNAQSEQAASELGEVREFAAQVRETLIEKYNEGTKTHSKKKPESQEKKKADKELEKLIGRADVANLKQAQTDIVALYSQFDPPEFEQHQAKLIEASEQLRQQKENWLANLEELREKSHASLAVVAPTDFGNVLAADAG